MCTATNSAIPTAPVREEWHTRLTRPRRVSAGGSCWVRVVACAACQAAARPAPSTRGRTGSYTGTSCTATHSAIPTAPMLLCIEAKFCNKICVVKLSPRSTRCTPLHRSLISKFSSKFAFFGNICQIFADFVGVPHPGCYFLDPILHVFP